MMRFGIHAICALTLVGAALWGQETRSMIFGRILDPQNAAVAEAGVTLRNRDTGVVLSFRSNATGYYEGNLLLPGSYEATVEAPGFKRLVRKGITLPVSSRLEIDLIVEVGAVSDTVSVTAEAPLLETNAVSSGRVLDNKTVMELPVMGNSAMLLVKLTPGIQTGGVNNYLALHSNAGGSDYSVGGNVGGNSWSIDGSPNQGPGRRAAYLPYTDAISEFKVETNNFDASIGQTSGASIQMISKSGSNDFHGTMTWQHWQQRWQGTPFFVKQQYFRRIAAADAAGNRTLADQIRSTDKQPTGRSNNWGASGGGPVIIPKLYNGKNRLFWFFTYNAFKDVKVEDPSQFNRTVPTLNAQNGDFSDLLNLPNASRYVIYDPTTVAPDPARPTHYLRTPFPQNTIPKSRFVNPSYNAIAKLYPLPNNPPLPGQEPVNNYLASQTPYNWDYKAYSNRVDYQISNRFRMYGRWSFNNFGPEDRADWTYETARGLNLNGLVRNNKGGNIDLVYTQNASTLWDFNLAMNQFREGNIQSKALEFKPSDIGLPAYLDAKAGSGHILPQMNVNGYSTISPGGISAWTRTRSATLKAGVTHVRGNHTMQAAFDTRNMFRTGGGGGNTSGNFTFSNSYTRRDDDGNSPSTNLGLGWAAFILGIPNGISIATNDNYATFTPYYAGFIQDNWRVNPKLTINLGLRSEWEGGDTERYNRMIAGFDPTLNLPITTAAEAAYAANPIPELAAANFKVAGGSLFPGKDRPRNLFKGELMWLPRFGAAYQLNGRTVIRAGYGIFFDTLNVMNFGPDQSGFSRSTSTNVTNDFGQNWNFPASANPANGLSPLVDPFPVRADGTRFDVPTRDGLGIMAKAGRGFGFTDFNQPHARQQRWRAGFQRQIGKSMVIDAAYAGSYSDRLSIGHKLDPLAEQYWANGTVRNDAISNNLNANVPNPFNIKNFAALKDTNPLVYQDLTTQGFFTSSTIRRHQLLRAFPQMNGVTNNTTGDGYNTSHELQLSLEKRFSRGFNFNFGYTAMKLRSTDFYLYEWDQKPTERLSNSGRPQRVVGSGIFEVPVGKGKRFLNSSSKPIDLLLSGWQFGATYEWQPGPLVDWGNLFYYGNDINNVAHVKQSWDSWFNTSDFERNPSNGPTGYHRRVFPTRIGAIRRDMTNQWNANAAKNLHIHERWNMQVRMDVLNVQNRSQMDSPSTDPFSTNFGRITSQTAATNRWIQVQARLTF